MFYNGCMSAIPIRTLNQETSKVLARVKAGEEVTVTERGAVIARIVPVAPSPFNDLVVAGRVRPAAVRGLAPRPTLRAVGETDAGTLLRSMREEERY